MQKAAGMEPVGVYSDQASFRAGKGYTIREIDGIKIAFVAFTKGMDGMGLPAGSEDCVNLLYEDYYTNYQTINKKGIRAILRAAESEKPDITIALLHWGSENTLSISNSQEDTAALMFEAGVDVILGSHSHIVGQMEYRTITRDDIPLHSIEAAYIIKATLVFGAGDVLLHQLNGLVAGGNINACCGVAVGARIVMHN